MMSLLVTVLVIAGVVTLIMSLNNHGSDPDFSDYSVKVAIAVFLLAILIQLVYVH